MLRVDADARFVGCLRDWFDLRGDNYYFEIGFPDT